MSSLSSSAAALTGLHISFVSKIGFRYEGIICHVDVAAGRIFLGRAVNIGREDDERTRRKGRLIQKLLQVDRGQIKSIEIMGEEDDEEVEQEEEEEDNGGGEVSGEEPLTVTHHPDDKESKLNSPSVDDSGFASAGSDSSSPPSAHAHAPVAAPAPPADKKGKEDGAGGDAGNKGAGSAADDLERSFREALSTIHLPPLPLPLPPSSWRIPLAMTRKMVQYHPKGFPDYVVPPLLDNVMDREVKEWDEMSEEEARVVRAVRGMLEEGVNAANYKQFLSFLLYAEEAQVRKRDTHKLWCCFYISNMIVFTPRWRRTCRPMTCTT